MNPPSGAAGGVGERRPDPETEASKGGLPLFWTTTANEAPEEERMLRPRADDQSSDEEGLNRSQSGKSSFFFFANLHLRWSAGWLRERKAA
jgi:hypothetical protein